MEIGKTDRIVLAHTKEIEEVRKEHPEISRRVDAFVQELHEELARLKTEVKHMDAKTEQDLAKVLLINNIHKMTDQVFL